MPDEVLRYLDRVRRRRECRSARDSASAGRSEVARGGQARRRRVVGSALVEVLERGEDPQRFLRSLAGA